MVSACGAGRSSSRQGVGTVVSGTLMTGTVQPNDTLLLGPDSTGKFQPVQIKSMHRKRVNVLQVPRVGRQPEIECAFVLIMILGLGWPSALVGLGRSRPVNRRALHSKRSSARPCAKAWCCWAATEIPKVCTAGRPNRWPVFLVPC